MNTPLFHRHPNPLEIVSLCRASSVEGVRLSPPPGNRSFSRLNDMGCTLQEKEQASEALNILFSSDMGAMLTSVFGSPDTVVPGKYRDAEVFGFEANGEMVVAITEAGDRGSAWFWFPRPDTTASLMPMPTHRDADDPEVAHFWPDFVDGLMTALGRPLSRPDLVFPPDALPMTRRLANQISSSLSTEESYPFSRRFPRRI